MTGTPTTVEEVILKSVFFNASLPSDVRRNAAALLPTPIATCYSQGPAGCPCLECVEWDASTEAAEIKEADTKMIAGAITLTRFSDIQDAALARYKERRAA